MRIPRELLPEIIERHERGQSDQAIATWLARLDPPIEVSRVAVLKARRTAAAAAPKQAAPARVLPSSKPSGDQGRKARAARGALELLDHARRVPQPFSVAAEDDPLRAHMYELRVLLAYQQQINEDTFMPLPERARYSVAIAQAMGKIRVDAELEAHIEQLELQRATEADDLQAERTQVNLARRALEAERKDLEAEWKRLHEERERLAGERKQQS